VEYLTSIAAIKTYKNQQVCRILGLFIVQSCQIFSPLAAKMAGNPPAQWLAQEMIYVGTKAKTLKFLV
jgi:hypothetical protein